MAQQTSSRVEIRRRLIGFGALVLISLAISPFLFDAAGFKERQLENRIPPPPPLRPLMELTQENQPITADSLEPLTLDDSSPAPLAPEIEEAVAGRFEGPSLSEDTPRLDLDGLPIAWTLQLASFRDERNAKSLRSDLNEAGYKVYIRHSDEMVRVYIGPEMQRSRLEDLQEKIKQDYSLDGMIVRFTTE